MGTAKGPSACVVCAFWRCVAGSIYSPCLPFLNTSNTHLCLSSHTPFYPLYPSSHQLLRHAGPGQALTVTQSAVTWLLHPMAVARLLEKNALFSLSPPLPLPSYPALLSLLACLIECGGGMDMVVQKHFCKTNFLLVSFHSLFARHAWQAAYGNNVVYICRHALPCMAFGHVAIFFCHVVVVSPLHALAPDTFSLDIFCHLLMLHAPFVYCAFSSLLHLFIVYLP